MRPGFFRALFFGLALLVLTLPLAACDSKAKSLAGRWETTIEDEELGKVVMVYHFTEDSQIFLEQKKGDTIPFSIPFGTYSVKGDALTIKSENREETYAFSVTAETLILSVKGQEDLVFTRV